MTDHEDRPERSPTTAKDARSDAELDAIVRAADAKDAVAQALRLAGRSERPS